MGWEKNGLFIQPISTPPDFAAYAGYMYVNTEDGTLYMSLGNGLWNAITPTLIYSSPQYFTGSGSVSISDSGLYEYYPDFIYIPTGEIVCSGLGLSEHTEEE